MATTEGPEGPGGSEGSSIHSASGVDQGVLPDSTPAGHRILPQGLVFGDLADPKPTKPWETWHKYVVVELEYHVFHITYILS